MLSKSLGRSHVPGRTISPLSSIYSGIKLLSYAMQIRRERRALSELDDRLLKDIGLSRSSAYEETHRRFLDVPDLHGRTTAGRSRFRIRSFR